MYEPSGQNSEKKKKKKATLHELTYCITIQSGRTSEYPGAEERWYNIYFKINHISMNSKENM